MKKRLIVGALGLLALAGGLTAALRAEGSHAATGDERPTVLHMVAEGGPGQASDFQQAILADGAVTDVELQSAYDATFACMDAAGVEALRPGDPRMAEGARLGFVVRADQDRAAVQSSVRDCQDRYLERVQLAHALLQGKGAKAAP